MSENVTISREFLNRICGMIYATRGEQHRLNFINDTEYAALVRLRHNGHDAVDTVLTALDAARKEANDAK